MTDPRIPVDASLFAALRARRPELVTARASKGTMVATSHLIEDLVARSPAPCVLLSGFQHGRHWAVERDRYLQLAGGNEVIAVFAGDEPPPGWEARHVGVRLRDGDPLTQEWFVLAIGPDIAVTLCGLDAGTHATPPGADPTVDDSDRLFEVIWSFDPDIAHAALDVVVDAVAEAAPDRVDAVRSAVAGAREAEVDAAAVARSADHLVAGLVGRLERSRAIERATARQMDLAKNQFLSRMSHELRTPLNVVLGFSQLLQLEAAADADREGLAHIERAGRHLLGLIDEVLDISRIEEGRLDLELEAIPVSAAVAEVLSLSAPLAAERGITVDAAAAEASSRLVWADRRRLRQVLLNVVQNAVKYNVEGGRIDVGVVRMSDGLVRIAIRDTGPGIATDSLERIFMPFERASEPEVEGTGLGLPISQRLARAMGGRIEVDSRVGGGATFMVALPEARSGRGPGDGADTEGDAAASPASAAEAAPAEIVYVEDNPPNVRLVERALEGRHVVVRTAPTAEEGLLLARGPVRPALVLLDLDLPDQPGITVLEHLRADPELHDVPVVVVSSDAMPATAERLAAAGATAYLTKPLDLRTFLDTVDALLAQA